MNNSKQEEQTNFAANNTQDNAPTTLLSGTKLQEATLRSEALPLPTELNIDPLYTPLIKAAEELRLKIEANHKENIESLKRETAEQTQTLYHKLTEAREEFKSLEIELKNKNQEIEKLIQTQQTLDEELSHAREHNHEQIQKIEQQQQLIQTLEQENAAEIHAVEEQSSSLIEKLKAKIEQITQDHHQQISNLQQKLNYEQQRLNDELQLLNENHDKTSQELNELQEQRHLWEETSNTFEDKIKQLEWENNHTQLTLKEKAEKLLRCEHSLKLAHEELQRSQDYIKELEEKNNTLQKELFENWINKKDEL